MTEDRVQHLRAWLAAVLLAIAAVICTADRTLPGLLMEPIKHSLSLTDTEIGILTGFTFTISMTIAALPLAWLADRYDRVLLLSGAIAAWCILTIASGFARDFQTLFLFRLGVGIGEAALLPASLSLLADLFPLDKLARASALLAYSVPLGTFMAMTGGGELYEAMSHGLGAGVIPFAGEESWRSTTIIFGAAGLIAAMLTATLLPEPRRRKAASVLPSVEAARSNPSTMRAYLPRAAMFILPYLVCTGVFTIFLMGFNTWLAPFFSRSYGWSVGEIGRVMGFTALVSGLIAPAVGLFFNAAARRWLDREAPVAAICIMMTLALPLVVLGPLAPDGMLTAAAFGASFALMGGCTVIAMVVYASMAPAGLRARMVAIVHLICGLAGSTGAILYAGFTDLVLENPAKLYLTISVLSGLLLAISILAGLIADRRYSQILALSVAFDEDDAAPLSPLHIRAAKLSH